MNRIVLNRGGSANDNTLTTLSYCNDAQTIPPNHQGVESSFTIAIVEPADDATHDAIYNYNEAESVPQC